MKTRLMFLSLAVMFIVCAAPTQAVTITWTGTAPGNWNFTTNWTPQQVPTTNDHVIISSGTITVPADATFGILDWSGGAITGPLTVITNSVLNLAWNSLNTWAGSLTNGGVVNVTGSGQLNLAGGTINNLANGVIDFKASPTWAGVPAATFRNAGLVRKTAGAGTTQIGLSGFPVNFTNTGLVEADIGTITFNNGGIIDGAYQAASGAIVNFVSGGFIAGNPVISGTGSVKFTGTTLTLPTNVITGLQMLGGTVNLGPAFQAGSITNLTLGATLGGTNLVTGTLSLSNGMAGALTVANGGTFNLFSGNFTGPVTVMNSGVMNLNASALVNWTGPLTNSGLVNVNNAGQLNVSGGPINNLASGVFDFKANQTWAGVPSATFLNAGLLRKTAGTGISQLGVGGFPINFTNTGTIEADIGTISFESGGLLNGNYQATNGAAINFENGAFAAASPVISGAGIVKFTGTSLTLLNNVIPGLQLLGGTLNVGPAFQGGSITNLTLPGIALAGTNTVTGTATLGGGFSGVLTVASNGVVASLTGLSQGSLIVAGGATVNWTNGAGQNGLTGSVIVMSNGVLNLRWNALMILTGSLTNAGLVNVLGAAQFNVSGGPLNNQPNGVIDFKVDSLWAGLPASFYNAGLVRKTAGTGTTQLGVLGYPLNFTNTGTIEADTGAILFDTGTFADTSAASIALSLGGATAGTNYGRISFVAPPLFHASLAASTRNGFLPAAGQTFKMLSYPSSTNQFNCLAGLDLGGGILLQPQFSTNGLTLIAAAYITNAALPKLFINPTLGGVAIVWPASFSAWTLLSTTNLSSPVWLPVSGACGNEALVPGTPPQFFRLKN